MSEENASTGQVDDATAEFGQQGDASGRESSIQRLKRQRNEAMQARQDALAAMARMDERMKNLEEKIDGIGQQPSQGSGPGDFSLEDLRRYATSEEVLAEKPHVANQAMLEYFDKLLEAKLQARDQEHESTLRREFEQRETKRAALEQVRRYFGDKALQRGSELYELADQIYTARAKRYGGEDKLPPDELLNSFALAKMELDRRKSDFGAAESEDAAGQAPPSGAIEGGSDGTADMLAELKAAREKGDYKSAFKLHAKALGFDD